MIVSTISSSWPSIEELEEIAEEQIKEVAGDIFRACVKLSPVYSGAYRASWKISFNSPDYGYAEGGSPVAPLRGASFRWPRGFKLGDEVIISNNVPYAELIEFGWSKQAPFGVLSVATAALA